MFCVLGDYDFQAPVLRQVVRGSAMCEASVLHQAIWGLYTISELMLCVKLLGDYNVQAPVLRQAVRDCSASSFWEITISELMFYFQASVLREAIRRLHFPSSCFASIYCFESSY